MRDNTYDIGDVVTMSIELVDEAGDPIDPTTLTLRVMLPAGTLVDWDLDDLTKDSTGCYHADYMPAARGTYEYLFVATGTVNLAEEKKFIVRRPRVPRPT